MASPERRPVAGWADVSRFETIYTPRAHGARLVCAPAPSPLPMRGCVTMYPAGPRSVPRPAPDQAFPGVTLDASSCGPHAEARGWFPRLPPSSSGRDREKERDCHSEGARAAPSRSRHRPATEESTRPGRCPAAQHEPRPPHPPSHLTKCDIAVSHSAAIQGKRMRQMQINHAKPQQRQRFLPWHRPCLSPWHRPPDDGRQPSDARERRR